MSAPRTYDIPLTKADIKTLEGMLGELAAHRLEVGLVWNRRKEKAADGMKIRVVLDQNAEWYRALCHAYPAPRKHNRTTFQTVISRKDTITALERMIKNKKIYYEGEKRISNYIPLFRKQYKEQVAYEKKTTKNMNRLKPIQDVDDDFSPF